MATTTLLPAPTTATKLAELENRTREFIDASTSPATRRAYRSDWKAFSSWCDERGLQSLPASPRTVANYLSDHADRLKVATLRRRLTTISQAHATAGYVTPTKHAAVERTWKGIKREKGTAPTTKQALERGHLLRICERLDDSRLIDIRDRALLLVGWMAALRRSEVVALDVEDLAFTDEGLEVAVRRSKADQEGEGCVIGIPYSPEPQSCPVRALRAWLEASGITSGPVFVRINGKILGERISGRAYAERVKIHAGAVGLDAAQIGGHSTRRGFITSSVRLNIPERIIMKHSRHKSLAVFRSYVESAGVWQENAAALLLSGGAR